MVSEGARGGWVSGVNEGTWGGGRGEDLEVRSQMIEGTIGVVTLSG